MTLRLGNKKVCPTKIVKVNNVDFSKLNYQNYINANSAGKPILVNGYYTRFDSALIVSSGGVEYSANSGVIDFSQPFEINCEFIAPTTAGGAIFGNCYNSQYFRCPSAEFQANGATTIWTAVSTDGTTWTNQFAFETDEVPTVLGGRYIINHKYDGSNYTVSVTYNGNTVTKTQALSTPPYFRSGSSATSSYFGFGGTANNYNLQFKDGKIWIGNTYIKQNDVLTWGCENGQNYIEVDPNNYLISNVTKVGEVEDNKGVLSGFTVNNYAKNNPLSISATEDLSVVTKFTAGNEISSNYVILDWMYQTNTDNTALRLYISNGNLIWQIHSSDNTHIVENFMGSNIIANTTYYAKFDWDSTNNLWTCSISTDGINWTTETTASGGMIGNIAQIDWGRWYASNFTFNGSIDLNECYVISGGQTVWQGVVPQGTRG